MGVGILNRFVTRKRKDPVRGANSIRDLIHPTSGDPSPLYHGNKNFGLIWSPKSGCTLSLLWFLGHLDLLEAQNLYSSWPHDYRTEVLFISGDYHRWIWQGAVADATWVRVIRDPLKRAVSSYEQSVLNGYNDEAVAKLLGRPVDADNGYSFGEYIEWLSGVDLARVNPHEASQRHRIEDLVTPFVVNIDRTDLWQSLSNFEDLAAIPPMSGSNRLLLAAEAERVGSLHHKTRAQAEGAPNIPFSRGNEPAIWPRYSDYLADDVRQKIRAIYSGDLEAYGKYL